ncbi:MAG: nuclear transport factor 2 family protein [Phenylobacterium sp.]|uniref:nuclear transport factor 2 family protein n=1 Tax=Phenylobacterium sp. TaxID=1871053 RepID=UPI001A52954E|nr:nuclear transport factor 2 family protein [Phenylobacterium sp.]MBL8772102.1 nuclear transport factor 2 family protein [Phenylobacterium sp.]
MTELERMLIEHACQKLQMLYGVHADRGEVEAFTQLFAADGSVAVPEAPAFVGHAAIRASMQALADQGIAMRHVMTNPVVHVVDADRATGSCYLTVYNSAAEPDAAGIRPVALPATVGEYADVFRRTDEGWRFQSRVLTRVFRPSPPS